MPLFGANCRGDFVGMPTCWPFDERSDPEGEGSNVVMLDTDLLLQKKTLQEIRDIAAKRPVCSIPGLTFMSALSDADGNVLHIVPGQGYSYYEKPEYKILTNFSPYKQNSDDFDVEDSITAKRWSPMPGLMHLHTNPDNSLALIVIFPNEDLLLYVRQAMK